MSVDELRGLAEILACAFTFLTAMALFVGWAKDEWKERADVAVAVFTLLTGASLFWQWSLGIEITKLDKVQVARTDRKLNAETQVVDQLKIVLEQARAEGKATQDVAAKLAEEQKATAVLTRQLEDERKAAIAAAANAPAASTGGGGG